MAEVNPPLYVPVDGAYSADELILPFRDIMGEGVVGKAAGELLVSQRAAGVNKSVDVAIGAAWIKGDDGGAAQGTYRVRSDSVVNLAIAANASGLPRVDRIIARVYDQTFAGALNTWALEVQAGVPTAGATAANGLGVPALPNGAIELALVELANGYASVANANITDKRGSALVGGGAALSSAVGDTRYRDSTATDVNTTVAETDLLAGLLGPLAAGVLGTNKTARITVVGDMLNNTGAAIALPRLRFKLGGTTLIDTNTPPACFAAGTTRWGWKCVIEVTNIGSTGAQEISFHFETSMFHQQAVSSGSVAFTTGVGGWGPETSPAASNKQGAVFAIGRNAGAKDSTAALALALTTVNGSALATCSTKRISALVEVI